VVALRVFAGTPWAWRAPEGRCPTEGALLGAEGFEGVVDGGGEGRADWFGAGAGEDFCGGVEAGAGLGFRTDGGEAGAFGVLGEIEEAVFGGGEFTLEGAQFVVGRGFGVGAKDAGTAGGETLQGIRLESGSHGRAGIGVV